MTIPQPVRELNPIAEEDIRSAAAIVQDLGLIAMQFADIQRVPRYTPNRRENDAEHSFMLALVASELAADYFPNLDAGLVSQFSIIHDLIELETGDVATFGLDDAAIHEKEQAEHRALNKLTSRLPHYTARLLLRYELQQEPEARFVRLVDKSLPAVVDIHGPGKQVMAEDYGVTGYEQLQASEEMMDNRYRNVFPEPELDLLHTVRQALARRFAETFE